MAHRMKPERNCHSIRIGSDICSNHADIVLVKGERRAYLRVAIKVRNHPAVATFSGEKTLRALAHAILAEVGEERCG